jgi:hypothetical protein
MVIGALNAGIEVIPWRWLTKGFFDGFFLAPA